MNVAEIINTALLDIARSEEKSFFLAQGVTDPNAVFGTLRDLDKVLPNERLIEMPVAEACGVGAAIGAALNGFRPIISLHRVEFLLPALEQLFNNAAKANFISGGKYHAPILIRAVIGRGWGQGPCHSQGFESMFASVPGLKVVCPSVPQTAYSMIMNAFYDNAPVVCLENRWVHYAESEGNVCKKSSELTGPIKLSNGDALTLVTYGYMTLESMVVVNEFRKFGVGIELIDLQSIRPLQLDLVFESIKKTGRVLVVDQGHKTMGVGGEVLAQIAEKCLPDLEVGARRLGLPDIPSPSSVSLASSYYISTPQILDECIALLPHFQDVVAIREKINELRANSPKDQPNEAFKGPF